MRERETKLCAAQLVNPKTAGRVVPVKEQEKQKEQN